MIPYAGDELTELIVQHYLVDFNMAEHMKLTSGMADEVEFTDIMSITHTIPSEEIWDLTHDTVDKITTEVAEKIKELNGDKSVSAAFVVGGGGKIHGFTEMLADKLEIPRERVALRGEEVLKEVHFAQEEIKKDPLLVTPIGICLNYYDQKNNFIMVRFNGERLKLYDNSHLTIVDAALQAGFPNEALFPRRGKAVEFTVNGKPRIVRGEPGESAIVKVDGRVVSINTPLVPNSEITIEASTIGKEAVSTIEQLDEYTSSTITFQVNGINITCPKFVQVNGSLEPSNYVIQEGDEIETRNFYTIGQLAEFMDVRIDEEAGIILNGKPADMGSLCYENFEIEWSASAYESGERHISYGQAAGAELTISGFTATYGGWVSILTAIAMCCFAFSTIIGWGLYGSRCIEFLGGEKFVRPFLVVYSFVSIVGATMNLGLLWDISDTFNGLMAVPNLIALLMLSGHVKKLAIEVDQAEKDGTI